MNLPHGLQETLIRQEDQEEYRKNHESIFGKQTPAYLKKAKDTLMSDKVRMPSGNIVDLKAPYDLTKIGRVTEDVMVTHPLFRNPQPLLWVKKSHGIIDVLIYLVMVDHGEVLWYCDVEIYNG